MCASAVWDCPGRIWEGYKNCTQMRTIVITKPSRKAIKDELAIYTRKTKGTMNAAVKKIIF